MLSVYKQRDLAKLEGFVKHPRIYGTWVCQTFLLLRKRYPLQFIGYYRKYRVIPSDNTKGDVVDNCYHSAVEEVNSLYAALHWYLINPPTVMQQQEFTAITNKLEDLLLRQNRDN